MKKQSQKSTIPSHTMSSKKNSGAARGKAAGATRVLFGATGITVLSVAAVGIAGFFAWRNRERILNFLDNYVDLPDSLKPDHADGFGDVPTLRPDNYSSTTSDQRM